MSREEAEAGAAAGEASGCIFGSSAAARMHLPRPMCLAVLSPPPAYASGKALNSRILTALVKTINLIFVSTTCRLPTQPMSLSLSLHCFIRN